jgi:hypothetical protein
VGSIDTVFLHSTPAHRTRTGISGDVTSFQSSDATITVVSPCIAVLNSNTGLAVGYATACLMTPMQVRLDEQNTMLYPLYPYAVSTRGLLHNFIHSWLLSSERRSRRFISPFQGRTGFISMNGEGVPLRRYSRNHNSDYIRFGWL